LNDKKIHFLSQHLAFVFVTIAVSFLQPVVMLLLMHWKIKHKALLIQGDVRLCSMGCAGSV